jgi:hypothetical protein
MKQPNKQPKHLTMLIISKWKWAPMPKLGNLNRTNNNSSSCETRTQERREGGYKIAKRGGVITFNSRSKNSWLLLSPS